MTGYKVLGAILLFQAWFPVHGQRSSPAKVAQPLVQSHQGKETRLLCATSLDNSSDLDIQSKEGLTRVRHCVWERLQARNEQPLIINFNDINSQPGLYSGVAGYSYSGDGFPEGDCGLKISFVKADDFAKWQCTLITDDKVYRGNVDLVRKPDPTTTSTTTTKKPSPSGSVFAVASSRTAIDDGKLRPIITSYNDARSILQPEIIVHSSSSNVGPQLIQEVKVESAGLEIKPRKGGKLIVFE